MMSSTPPSSGPSPRVTVVMPAFNAARTVLASVDSVLSQTFADFELLVVDDGSTDDTLAVLAQRSDPRLRVVAVQPNGGLVAALNRGIAEARGALIARLDADDVAFPERLAAQVPLFDDPDVVLSSTGFERVGVDGQLIRRSLPPADDGELRVLMLTGNRLLHSSIVVRRSVVLEVGGYRAEWFPVEDYDLWLRVLATGRYQPVPSVLVRYLHNPDGISAVRANEQAALCESRASAYFGAVTGRPADGVMVQFDGQRATSPTPAALRSLAAAARAIRTSQRRSNRPSSRVFGAARRVALGALTHESTMMRHLRLFAAAPDVQVLGWTGARRAR
jgi:glycosyltransferase involved in cell wall biosynthesis